MIQFFFAYRGLSILSTGSAAAKSDSIAKGVPLEDISDDDEDQYSDNEEEDIDLEVDSDTDNKSDKDDVESNEEDVESNEDDFESHEEIKKMPPKKVTPKKVEVKQKSITDQMSALNISKTPMFSMDFQLPFMISPYNEALDQMAKIELLVPMLPRDYFLPNFVNGKTLEIAIQVPSFFVDEDRVIRSNAAVNGFNINTHQAQAFKDTCEAINIAHGMKNAIYGNAMQICMPFVCEERVVQWEIQATNYNLGSLADDLGAAQFHAILSVTVRKQKSTRKTAGGFRIVPTAVAVAVADDDDDDDVDEDM